LKPDSLRSTRFCSGLTRRLALAAILLAVTSLGAQSAQSQSNPAPATTPTPLLTSTQAVDWWFAFKFNAEAMPGCGGTAQRVCTFGGTVQPYHEFSQQFAYASSANHTLQQGDGCIGDTTADPVGATFNQVYTGRLYYVLWNDQFYGNPIISEDAPEGHSKGMLAWDNTGNGFVLQVSTPSWPGSGSDLFPRRVDGNTLGCIQDNDVMVSQHFFALKLNKDDVVTVLKALQNASVVTDPTKQELVNNGGPADIQALVKLLGKVSTSKAVTKDTLSSGVVLISKPSDLHVPPWQMVSALLDGVSLRAATWWAKPEIPTTTASTVIGCWDSSLSKPGAVDIATSGTWAGKSIGLDGIAEPEGNHAKVGVSTSGTHSYSIFGDMNQQGSLSGPNCASSQNGRGGMFFVVDDQALFASINALLKGASGPPK
jgi:hypothetical protein